jgi:hypothetical protein
MYYPYVPTTTQPASQPTTPTDFYPRPSSSAPVTPSITPPPTQILQAPLSMSAPNIPTTQPAEIPTLAALSRSYVGILQQQHAQQVHQAQQALQQQQQQDTHYANSTPPTLPTTPPRLYQPQQAQSPSRGNYGVAPTPTTPSTPTPTSTSTPPLPIPVAPPTTASPPPPPSAPATPPHSSAPSTPTPNTASPNVTPAVRTVPEEYGLSSALTLLVTHIPHPYL